MKKLFYALLIATFIAPGIYASSQDRIIKYEGTPLIGWDLPIYKGEVIVFPRNSKPLRLSSTWGKITEAVYLRMHNCVVFVDSMKNAYICDLESRQHYKLRLSWNIERIMFSPDYKYIITETCNGVKVWDMDGNEVA